MLKNVNDKKLGLILVLLAAMFWGYVGVPTKHLADLGFDNYTISFLKQVYLQYFISYIPLGEILLCLK